MTREEYNRRSIGWLPTLLLLLVALSPAAAQEEPQVFVFDFGTVGLDTLALWSPSSIYRPIDMLDVRAGAKGWGMGGAYVAEARGLESVSWNPAGLAWLERTDLQADLLWLRSSAATSGFPDTFAIPDLQTINVTRYEVNLKSGARYNLLGAATRLTPLERLHVLGEGNLTSAIGLSFRRYVDVAYPEKIVEDLTISEGAGFPFTIAMDGNEEGGVDAATATLGLGLYDAIAIGANLNFLTGRLSTHNEQEVQTGGAQAISGEIRMRQDYKGLSTDIGAQFRTPDLEILTPFRIGFGIRYTPTYKLEVSNGSFYSRSLAAPGQPTILVRARLAAYDIDVPPLMTVGGNVRFSDRITVAADYSRQNWTEVDLTYHDKERTTQPTLPLVDVASLHFGIEAGLLTIGGIDFPLRVGYRSGPLSVAQLEPKGSVLQGDWMGGEIDTSALSFGAGLVSGPLRWDFSYEVLDYKLKKFYFDAPFDLLINPESTVVDVDRRVARLRLSATLAL